MGPTKTTLPRTITFNGKGKWSTYESQMDRFFRMHNVQNAEAQLYYLSTSLTGDASIYYERMANRLGFVNGKDEAFQVLRERYGEQNLIQSRVLEFNTTKQQPGEEIQEFQDRLNRIGDQAYPNTSEEELERHVLMRFTLGLLNQDAARHIMRQNTSNMRDAMTAYKLFTYSQTALNRSDKTSGGTEIIKISAVENRDYEHSTEGEEELDVCQLSQRGYQPSQRSPYIPRQPTFPPRTPRFGISPNQNGGDLRELVNKLALTVQSQGEKIDNLTKLMKTAAHPQSESKNEAMKLSNIAANLKSSGTSQVPAQKGKQEFWTTGCHLCGEKDHRVLNCPITLEYRRINDIRSTEIREEEEPSLNENGLTSQSA